MALARSSQTDDRLRLCENKKSSHKVKVIFVSDGFALNRIRKHGTHAILSSGAHVYFMPHEIHSTYPCTNRLVVFSCTSTYIALQLMNNNNNKPRKVAFFITLI